MKWPKYNIKYCTASSYVFIMRETPHPHASIVGIKNVTQKFEGLIRVARSDEDNREEAGEYIQICMMGRRGVMVALKNHTWYGNSEVLSKEQ